MGVDWKTGEFVTTVGIYRVKNEARWIAESLARTLEIADAVILFDDHSTDATRDIAAAFTRVEVIASPFEGLDEARDKDFLLGLALKKKPQWVAAIDGDEVFSKKAVQAARQLVSQTKKGGAVFFRIAYLWDRPDQERVDGVYANFRRARLYSIFDQDLSALHYKRTGFGGNFHCGMLPQGHSGHRGARVGVDHAVKHYGYMTAEDRQRKYEWYNTIDPANDTEGRYVHVIGLPDRHAPGPMVLRPFEDG